MKRFEDELNQLDRIRVDLESNPLPALPVMGLHRVDYNRRRVRYSCTLRCNHPIFGSSTIWYKLCQRDRKWQCCERKEGQALSTHFTSCRNEYDALTLAVLEARKSPCLSKRGAVIWNHGLLIASAHNNQAEPFECTRDALCKSHCGETAIHAEERAIMEALDWTDKEAVKGSQILHVKVNADGQSVYSGSPSCLRCSV